MGNRKVFLVKDPHGSVISMDSLTPDDVIIDSFIIETSQYILITRAVRGMIGTQMQQFQKEDQNGKKTGAIVTEPVTRGQMENVAIILTDKEEIESAWAWLHPGADSQFKGWEMVENQKAFIAKVVEWKQYPYNDITFDNHRTGLMEYLRKGKHTEVLGIIENLEALRIAKRQKEMDEMKIPREYLNQSPSEISNPQLN